MQDDISRRSFLRATGVAGAVVAVGEVAPGTPPRPSPSPELGRPPDALGPAHPGRGRPGPVRPARSGSTTSAAPTATPPASAPAAASPTTPPRSRFHHRSRFLGDRDPFGELVTGCRELGMVVLARTDPHATYDDVHEAHPDWIAVDAEGQPRRHWASPEMWVTCALGPYNFEFMTAVHREIMTRYQRRRHLHQPLGRLRDVLLRALPGELPGRDRPRAAPDGRPAGPGAAGVHRSGSRSGSSSSGGSGTRRSARSTPTRASSRTPGAARPARST